MLADDSAQSSLTNLFSLDLGQNAQVLADFIADFRGWRIPEPVFEGPGAAGEIESGCAVGA